MTAASTKSLFRAIKPKRAPQPVLADFPEVAPVDTRDPLDFDPTPPDATAAFLAEEAQHIRAHGNLVWETAVGAGHMAGVLAGHGFPVYGSDVVDRGWPGVDLRSFFDFREAPSPIQITNPPYGEISSRDGHGRWLRHAFDLGATYIAMLLNADWPFGRVNGFDQMFHDRPPSVEYACCWKIDFRGGGNPAQRNSWFVWDANRPPVGPNAWVRRRLYRHAPDARQAVLL